VLKADWSNRPALAAFDEGDDATDGEEITNKFPRIEQAQREDRSGSAAFSDVPDLRGLQAFPIVKAKEFPVSRNDSSIMRAKVLSIMRANPRQVTCD